ncbi:MAG: hypothetical protein ACP5U2_11375 [Bryobacteraceae bacterium]
MSSSLAFQLIREAEARLRFLSSSASVRKALAEAEVEFRARELEGNWREQAGGAATLPAPGSSSQLPAHWRAGIAYATAMTLAYGQAALDQIGDPTEFEAFLRECTALMADKTYRRKVQPYDRTRAPELGYVTARFRQFVESALAPEVARLKLEAWRRYRRRSEGAVPNSPEGTRLERHAGPDREDLVGPAVAPQPRAPRGRVRVPRSAGSPEAVRAVMTYMEDRGWGITQFATQAGTTDRTLRNFLKSGKMRRSTFEAMAERMGLSTEQLLRGELPTKNPRR